VCALGDHKERREGKREKGMAEKREKKGTSVFRKKEKKEMNE